MATNTNVSTLMRIILTKAEDWDPWFWQLRANVSSELWEHINPDVDEDDELELEEQPEKLMFSDYNQTATMFAGLNADQKREYEAAWRFYKHNLKHYTSQQKELQAARAYISSTMSLAKQNLLDPKQTVWQWVQCLQEDTEPPKGYMLMQTEIQYRDMLKAYKPSKIYQWLDEWEAVMMECIKYKLPEVQNGCWLWDLAQLIKSASEVQYKLLLADADDEDKADPSEFRTVARRLCLRLASQRGGRTVRGSAFQASFGEGAQHDDLAMDTKRAKTAPPKKGKGQKHTGTQSLETNVPKKGASECPACGMRGHSLATCWYIFQELKPGDVKLTACLIHKAEKTVEDDPELKKQVEEIQKKMEETRVAE